MKHSHVLGLNHEPASSSADESSPSSTPGTTPISTPVIGVKHHLLEISSATCSLVTGKLFELTKHLELETSPLPVHSLSGTVSQYTEIPDQFTSTSLLAALCLTFQSYDGDRNAQFELYYDNGQRKQPIHVHEAVDDTVGRLFQSIHDALPPEISRRSFDKQFQFVIGIPFTAENKTIPHPDTVSSVPRFLLTAIAKHNDLTLDAHYDDLVITRTRSLRLLWTISNILGHLLGSSSSRLTKTIPRLSPEDLETINSWNIKLPPAKPDCVHEAIAGWAAQTPTAEAIDAWDGRLSFNELHEFSSRLALYLLRSCSVKAGDIIPLCIGRSAIAIVSMLAVMKAGAAFVPLDPLGPKDRTLDIMDICGANNLVLSSYNEKYREAGIVVSWKLIEALPSSRGAKLPNVSPSDPAYVIFTSGTTGRPKGVVIEHQNLFYSLRSHGGDIYRQGPTSRVLQFAALTFDASMTEHLAPLTHGGCVCVPDHETRLVGIADYINTRRVNWAFFTPSFFKLLTPDDVPCLKTVVLGGEAITNDCIDRWSHRIRLINGYGPSEGTIVATACVVEPATRKRASIGQALACKTWVVDPDDHSQLLPIGAIGELVLQGPNVARGYLNDPVKTKASFVDIPWWAKVTDDARYQRMYKTGDLVRYDDQGSLIYIGRKDTQVKVRGQRLELGEVEHHLPVDTIQHGVALVPKLGAYNRQLVVVIVCRLLKGAPIPDHSGFQRLRGEVEQRAHQIIEDAKQSMSTKLPSFAVPDVWIPVQEIPTSKSGKLDRIAVRGWVESLQARDGLLESTEMHSEIDHGEDPIATQTDRIIQGAFAYALSLPLSKISLDRSFQSLGGDSLQAIQVVGRCRSLSLQLNINPILKGDTIRQLSLKSSGYLVKSCASEQFDSPFPLSPIQRLYSNTNPPSTHYFNQTRVIQLKTMFSPDKVLEALTHVVRAHSMLRVQLVRDGTGGPRQLIGRESDICFQDSFASSLEEAAKVIQTSQRAVDVCSGPVVAANYISLENQLPLVSVTAAHFSVDIVSWSIIFEDLESYFKHGRLSSPASLSFQTWCRQQAEDVESTWSKQRLLPFNLPTDDINSWLSLPNPNTYGNVAMSSLRVGSSATSTMLKACSSSSLSVLDILLAALFKGFKDSFPTLKFPVIHSEGHGRQTWRPDQDISRTVGWFTSLTPIPAPTTRGDDVWHAARSIRHFRGQLFHGGMPFFASHFSENTKSSDHSQPMAIVFNYMGQEQQKVESEDALFEVLHEFRGESGDVASANMPRFSIFEISAEVRHGEIQITFMWPEGLRCEGDLAGLVGRCHHVLETAGAAASALSIPSTSWPSCDLYQLPVDYDTSLSILKNAEKKLSPQPGDIIKISPTSATQRAMLLSQDIGRRFFQTRLVFFVQSPSKKLDTSNLLLAWKKLVSHHAILRTVFVRRPGNPYLFDQVILERIEPQVEILNTQSYRAETLLQLPPTTWEEHEPHHKLTVANSTSGHILILLECSHALIDFTSLQIMFRDLAKACSGSDGKGREETMQFVNLVDKKCLEVTHESDIFWRKLFSANPKGHLCQGVAYPVTWNTHRSLTLSISTETRTGLQSLCERTSLTIALLVRFAWAVVLSRYLQYRRVAFGYVVAGRDVDFSGIEGIVGPCLNILGCVADLDDGEITTAMSLENLREQFLNSLSYQHRYLEFSAASKLESQKHSQEHESVSTPTTFHFDTLVNFRSHNETNEKDNTLQFHVEGESDPFDYALVVEVDSYATGDMKVTFSYWEEAMSDDSVKELSDGFAEALGQIQQLYDQRVALLLDC
ncbi:acetyl-CoA synthetase-like protein [Xylariaceae sp. AK1471]|nr:acetyl-CoA synthetase-like protein [Xylariaceae sp. AK1471]